MDSRPMAALLSSLVSQLSLLLLLFFPSSPFSPVFRPRSCTFETLFSLTHHFLSSSQIASSLSLRKRSRTRFSDSDSDSDKKESKLARLDRVNSVLVKNPDSFRVIFRMKPSTFEWLCGLLEPLLECRDPVGFELNLSAELRLGIGLYRLSTGSDYPEIADRFKVTEQVAKFCCKQLCRVLCTNFRFWVGFPNSAEFDSVSNKFDNLTGLPNCCGVIGCTRFKIVTNCKEESISAQIVVDSSSRILSIFAGSNGDKSNLRVLKSSTLYKDIRGGRLLDSTRVCVEGVSIPQYLVGDNQFGYYPLLSWLMVQFDDAQLGSNEEKFNDCVGLMRVSMLKTVASLKSWGILSKPVKEELRNVVAYIGACSILHNALLLREDYSGLCDRVEDYSSHDPSSREYRDVALKEEETIEGGVIRNALATKAKNLSRIK